MNREKCLEPVIGGRRRDSVAGTPPFVKGNAATLTDSPPHDAPVQLKYDGTFNKSAISGSEKRRSFLSSHMSLCWSNAFTDEPVEHDFNTPEIVRIAADYQYRYRSFVVLCTTLSRLSEQ
jgi:hypothetical protein